MTFGIWLNEGMKIQQTTYAERAVTSECYNAPKPHCVHLGDLGSSTRDLWEPWPQRWIHKVARDCWATWRVTWWFHDVRFLPDCYVLKLLLSWHTWSHITSLLHHFTIYHMKTATFLKHLPIRASDKRRPAACGTKGTRKGAPENELRLGRSNGSINEHQQGRRTPWP